jgi:xanthine dehydrogenase accessory factor
MKPFFEELSQISVSRRDHVVVNLTAIKGSAPQIVGSKMIVSQSGLQWGTVGGGKIEAHCIRYAQDLLNAKSSAQSQTWNLQTDIGMSCGGEVTIFFDPTYFSGWTVAIFGAGHVAQELCRVMQTWSCQVKVYDTRSEWIEKLPNASNIEKKCVDNMALEVKDLPKGCFLLSMTQGHSSDVPVLFEALKNRNDLSFVGVIGSTVKSVKIKNELKALGIDSGTLDKLVCPIGLDFGNNTPPEISISIAAQLISLRPKEIL